MKKLKELRKSRKLTQQEIANALFVHRNTYQSYESGRADPDYEMLKKLAKFYGVTTDYLLDVDDYASKIGHPIVTILDDDDPVAKAEYEEWLAENGGVDRQSTAVEISDAVGQLDEEQQKALLTILGSMLKK